MGRAIMNIMRQISLTFFASMLLIFVHTANAEQTENAEAAPAEAAPAEAAPAEAAPAEAAPAEAEPPPAPSMVVVPPDADMVDLSPHLEWFEDADAKLTIDDISADGFQGNFKKLNEETGLEVPNFGLGLTSAYWFRIVVDNKSETIQWVVEDDYAALDSIHFYQKDADGNWQAQIAGDSEPFEGRYWNHPLPNFSFERWEGDTTPVYIRVMTTGAMNSKCDGLKANVTRNVSPVRVM